MARFKVFQVFVLLTLFSFVTSSKLIYRKYEKKHPKRNYVQIVEIFGTDQEPPAFSESDKQLNDFLAKDAYKTDMNCTKRNETDVTVKPVTLPTIPTTAFRINTTPMPRSTTSRTPNLTNLFTISTRPTKPSIKPNPKENKNPDYSDIDSPTVQVTKYPPNTNTPTIVIIAPDDQPRKNQTAVKDFDKELSRAVTTPSSVNEFDEDDEIIYRDSKENYNEENYDLVEEKEYDEGNREIEPAEDNEEYDEYDSDVENEEKKRRKRHKNETVKRQKNINKRNQLLKVSK